MRVVVPVTDNEDEEEMVWAILTSDAMVEGVATCNSQQVAGVAEVVVAEVGVEVVWPRQLPR